MRRWLAMQDEAEAEAEDGQRLQWTAAGMLGRVHPVARSWGLGGVGRGPCWTVGGQKTKKRRSDGRCDAEGTRPGRGRWREREAAGPGTRAVRRRVLLSRTGPAHSRAVPRGCTGGLHHVPAQLQLDLQPCMRQLGSPGARAVRCHTHPTARTASVGAARQL